ncbi:ImuA family protein [soil metagenome]
MKSIIEQLKQSILQLEGYKPNLNTSPAIRPFQYAFPGNVFPLGALHELTCRSTEDFVVTISFIAGLLSRLSEQQGICLWIADKLNGFPPALKLHGLEPDKFIFIESSNNKEQLWLMEEALKCEHLTAVVGEIKNIDFTASRRLQLVVEQSRVNGFILRNNIQTLNTIACIARWKITALPGIVKNDLPGVGFPQWNVELLKVRNGKPQSWQVAWMNGNFSNIQADVYTITQERMYKVG